MFIEKPEIFSQTEQTCICHGFRRQSQYAVSVLDDGIALVRYETVQRLEISYNMLQCDRLDIDNI